MILLVSCSLCKNKAIVSLNYAGVSLCGSCFTKNFEKRVSKANKEFKLLWRKDRIAVAISGGKDSAAMLFVLNKLTEKIGEIELIPVLIDEGIKGYRNNALEEAKKLCKKLGFSLKIYSFKKYFGMSLDEMIKKRNSLNSDFCEKGACSICGVFRKWLLNKAAQELEANKLAVGHNLDDVAQTVLMNLFRNEPSRFHRFGVLSGSEEKELFVRRIKPLFFCPERECAIYSILQGLPFYLGECPYSSEAYRGEVKNFLNYLEKKSPGVKFNVVHSFLSLKKELEYCESKKQKTGCSSIPVCSVCGQYSSSKVCKACEYLGELSN